MSSFFKLFMRKGASSTPGVENIAYGSRREAIKAGVPFWKRRYFGRAAAHRFQLAVGLNILLVIVAVPVAWTYINSWKDQMPEYIKSSKTAYSEELGRLGATWDLVQKDIKANNINKSSAHLYPSAQDPAGLRSLS